MDIRKVDDGIVSAVEILIGGKVQIGWQFIVPGSRPFDPMVQIGTLGGKITVVVVTVCERRDTPLAKIVCAHHAAGALASVGKAGDQQGQHEHDDGNDDEHFHQGNRAAPTGEL